MPTYEYLCQTCNHRFDQWQKMTDEPLTTCPECGKHIRRVFYPAGIVFKGSGFYKTDHPKLGANPNGHSHASEGEGTTEKKTTDESKPAESNNTPSSEHKSPASTGTK